MRESIGAGIAGLMALLLFPGANAATPSAWCTSANQTAAAGNPSGGAADAADAPVDYMDSIAACVASPYSYPGHVKRPDSAWIAREYTWATGVLAKSSAPVLVVPFQVQGYGIDRAERALMTLELGEQLSSAMQLAIADPRFASPAFGEGLRRLDPATFRSVGQSANALFAVVGYVGHDGQHHMALRLQVLDLRPQPPDSSSARGKLLWQHDWPAVPFSDEMPPALAFRKMLPSIVGEMSETLKAVDKKAQTAPILVADSTAALPKLAIAKATQSDPVVLLSVLGSLTGSYAELPRERLFERALQASWQKNDALHEFYTAYSLFQLQLRPAALAILGKDRSARSNTLRALLNGNLPDAEASLRAVGEPVPRLVLSLAVRDLAAAYKSNSTVQLQLTEPLLGVSAKVWNELIALRATDRDPWSVNSALAIKQAMDTSFPIAGLDVRSVLQGGAIARRGNIDEVDIDIASIRHVRAVQDTLQARVCCTGHLVGVGTADLLDVFASQLESRISKSLQIESDFRELPEQALASIERYRPLLEGHPLLELAQARADQQMMWKSPDDTRASWAEQTGRHALAALYYAQGMNPLAQAAVGIDTDPMVIEGYGYDYPLRSYWRPPVRKNPADYRALLLQSLAFSSTDPDPLKLFPAGPDPGQRAALMASFSNRFVGNPNRPSEIPLPGQPIMSSTGDRVVDARAAVRSAPRNFENYMTLARALIETTGDYAGAAQGFQSYFQLRSANDPDPVETSNDAYSAATYFCYQGQFELCEPLLKIAANLDTGSGGSMAASDLLRVLSGDYAGAMAISFAEVERYQEAHDYREAFIWLHAFGQSEQAWAGFSQVMASFDEANLWTAALIGQRRAGLNEAAARAWMLRPEIRGAQYRGRQFAQYYAILFNVTDRMPPADLGSLIDRIEGERVGKVQGPATVRPASVPDSHNNVSMQSIFRRGKAPRPPDGTPVRSDLAMFADGYVAIRNHNFELAVSRLNSMADFYWLLNGTDSFALPYLAWAEAKSGDQDGLEAELDKSADLRGIQLEGSFDYYLAKAFFAGGRHDASAAYGNLKRAFRMRPSSQDRPVETQYQYAEACEWLYAETSDVRFRDELLDWAGKWQVVRPADPWTYSMQYTYQTSAEQQLRALAMMLWLDPASARISKASASQKSDAQAWLKAHNPFRAETAQPRTTS